MPLLGKSAFRRAAGRAEAGPRRNDVRASGVIPPGRYAQALTPTCILENDVCKVPGNI
jgi:hypothetical protein